MSRYVFEYSECMASQGEKKTHLVQRFFVLILWGSTLLRYQKPAGSVPVLTQATPYASVKNRCNFLFTVVEQFAVCPLVSKG